MTPYRPYRFPPLSQLIAGGAADSAWQASVADGYAQGQRDGYDTGFERGRQDGYASGRDEGLRDGRAQAASENLADFDKLARPLDAALAGLRKVEADYRAAQRKEVVELVARVARQVIRAELALQPMQLLALVDDTLAAMPPTREDIDVYLNPEELKRISELDPQRARQWNLVADARLDAGECHIRAGDDEVDAGCLQRLAAVMEQVSTQLSAADGVEETLP